MKRTIIMVDIEKDLGPLFDELEKEGKLERYRRRDQSTKDEYNEFKDICDDLIAPLMREYQKYLRKKVYTRI